MIDKNRRQKWRAAKVGTNYCNKDAVAPNKAMDVIGHLQSNHPPVNMAEYINAWREQKAQSKGPRHSKQNNRTHVDWKSLNQGELKAACRMRDLAVRGKVSDLVKRLKDYEKQKQSKIPTTGTADEMITSTPTARAATNRVVPISCTTEKRKSAPTDAKQNSSPRKAIRVNCRRCTPQLTLNPDNPSDRTPYTSPHILSKMSTGRKTSASPQITPTTALFNQLADKMANKTSAEKKQYYDRFHSKLFPLPTAPRQLDLSFQKVSNVDPTNAKTTAPPIATLTAPLAQATYNNKKVNLSADTDSYPPVGGAFHFLKPHKNGQRGKHRSEGRPGNYDYATAAKMAASRAKAKVKSALQDAGDWDQQRETLFNLLTDPEFRDMYRSLGGTGAEESIVGKHVLDSMKKILRKVLHKRSKNSKLKRKQRQFTNCVCSLVMSLPVEVSGISKALLGRHLGLSHGQTYNLLEWGKERAEKILDKNDESGYDLVDEEKVRAKFSPPFLKKFDHYVENECELIIENPCKGDTIWKRDRKNKVIRDASTNKPVKVQKKLLLASYRELLLDVIANFPDAVKDNKVVISESTLRRIMPKHIKKATPRYKLMCGCQTCVIINDMYYCIIIWRKRFISMMQIKINKMPEGPDKIESQVGLDEYKKEVKLWKERAWDAATQLACPKIEVKEQGEAIGRHFHHFSCVMGACGNCPKWNSIIPKMERESTLPIRYSLYSGYHTCSEHKEMHIATDADKKRYCTECKKLSEETLAKLKPTLKKKSIRMKKSEPMDEFMKEGGTFNKYLQHMLYHSTLVIMNGSTVCGKSVEKLVKSNDNCILLRRDHSERYTPRPNGELQSEGLGMEDSVSIEGASLLYKAVGTSEFQKGLYCHISDDKKQNAATVLNNILYMLDDLDKRKEIPRGRLKEIFDIVDGCAVQYRCFTVLYSLALLAQRRRIRFTRCVQAPGQGKAEIDGLLGTEKTYGDTRFDRPALLAEEEAEDVDLWADMREQSSSMTDSDMEGEEDSSLTQNPKRPIQKVPIYKMENGVKLSLAKRVFEILSDPGRSFYYKYDRRKIKWRRYHYRLVGSVKSHNVKMTGTGFPKDKRSGIGSYYCFMADPELGLAIAARRFFCGCKGCQDRLKRPISERYSGPWKECKYWDIFKIDENRGWNDVSIISFSPGKGCDEEELNATLDVALNDIGIHNSLSVTPGGFGAYGVDSKIRYYMVQWTGEPRQLEEDKVVYHGNQEVQLFAGEWVCEGMWLHQVPGARYWYTVGTEEVTIRMKGVLQADLEMTPLSSENPLPSNLSRRTKAKLLGMNPVKLDVEDHDFLMDESHRRDNLDHEEDFIDSDDSDDDSSTGDEEEDAYLDGVSSEEESESGSGSD